MGKRQTYSKRSYTPEERRLSLLLASRIKALRYERQATQEQISELAEMSNYAYQKLENGQVVDPRLHTLTRVSAALGISVVDLLAEDGDEG